MQAVLCMDLELRAHYHHHADTWLRLARMAEFQDTFAESKDDL